MSILRLLSVLAIAGVALIFLLVLVWLGQRRLMYFPSANVVPPADAGVPQAQSVTFETADHLKLAAWFVPAASSRATVIVFNGNAGNRSHRGSLAAALSRAGFSVLLFDYRGYGGNEGSPSETGLITDARAARAYVAARPDVDARRLVYFGESLGTAVALALAAEEPPAALILRSPFTSAIDVGRYHYPVLPVRWLLIDRFQSIEHIRRVSTPSLFIAGDRDSIVPAGQTRALFDAAREPKALVVIPGADHNDAVLFDGHQMIAAVVAFLNDHLSGGTTATGSSATAPNRP